MEGNIEDIRGYNSSCEEIGSLTGEIQDDSRCSCSCEAYDSLSGGLSLQVTEVIDGDYNKLDNLPSINGVVLMDNKTSKDLHIERGYDAEVDPDNGEHLILKL